MGLHGLLQGYLNFFKICYSQVQPLTVLKYRIYNSCIMFVSLALFVQDSLHVAKTVTLALHVISTVSFLLSVFDIVLKF
jgi:hypothetical protein